MDEKIIANKEDLLLHVVWKQSTSTSLCIRIDVPDGYLHDDYEGFRLRIDNGSWIECKGNMVIFTNLTPNSRYSIDGEYRESGRWVAFRQKLTTGTYEKSRIQPKIAPFSIFSLQDKTIGINLQTGGGSNGEAVDLVRFEGSVIAIPMVVKE